MRNETETGVYGDYPEEVPMSCRGLFEVPYLEGDGDLVSRLTL